MSNDMLLPVIIVAVGGGLGGFLRGLMAKTEYTLTIPFSNKKVSFGFVGDLLCGAAGGMAIFLIAASLMQDNLQKINTNAAAFIQVCGLTVVAGFIGPQLLTLLSRKLVGEELDKLGKEVGQLEDTVRQMKTRAESDNLVQIGEFHSAQARYNTAIRFYEQALIIDPTNDFALTRVAYSWKRLNSPLN